MMYGKIVCGALVVPQNYPGYIELEGKKIYNPTEEQYLAAGYLPIEESEPPADVPDGKQAEAVYEVNEAGTAIVQSWVLIDLPPEVTPEVEGGEE